MSRKSKKTAVEFATITISKVDVASGSIVDDLTSVQIPITERDNFARTLGIMYQIGTQDAKPKANVIYKHAECVFSVGNGRKVWVNETENDLLSKFLGHPAHTVNSLKNDASVENIPQAFKRLVEKYNGYFARAIKFPGVRGMGGYRATVELKNS